MKKFLAILVTICLLAGALSVTAFAASDVLTISAIVKGKTAPVLIGSYTNFKDGWNAAMEIAGDDDTMDENGYDRIVVDLLTDWKANDDGQFSDDWRGGAGFDNDTIYVPADARVTLNLNGHTIDRGLTKDEDDGEIMFINDDADVIINNGTITGGYSNSEGGCLYIEGGANVTLNDVHIIGNKVYNDDGAGVYMYGGSKLTVNGGSFENNSTDGNNESFYYGGAVCIYDSTAIFNNVAFKNNRCKNYGAAIYADDSDITIKNCTVDGSYAQSSVFFGTLTDFKISGSAIVNSDANHMFELEYSTLIINDSEFKNNDLNNILYTKYNNTVQVTNSTFTDNASRVIDACSYGLSEGSYFRDCTFGRNTYKDSNFRGNFANMAFYDCDFGDSTFKSAENMIIENSKESAANAVLGVTLLHKDGTEKTAYYTAFDFGWNSAVDAAKTNNYERVIVDLYADWNSNEYGVITIPSDARMTINMNGHFIDRGLGDSNEYSGEVIYVKSDADLTINGGKDGDAIVKSGENTGNVLMGKISGGNSDNGAGGIHICSDARVTLNNVNLIGNAVDDDDGAAIAAYDGAILTMNGGSVSNNTLWCSFMSVAWSSGGIYLNNAKAYLKDVEFADNIFRGAEHAYGVAIFSDDSDVIAENCTFKHNGYRNSNNNIWTPISVISVDGGSFDIRNCLFEDNGTKEISNGPDMINIQGGIVRVSNSIFRNNSSSSAIFCNYGAVEVTDTIFEGTTGNVFRGEADEGSFFKNCTFSGNSTDNSYKTFAFGEDNALDFENCNFGDSTFNDRSRATFDGAAGAGSIIGGGSFAVIIAFIALLASAASFTANAASGRKRGVKADN